MVDLAEFLGDLEAEAAKKPPILEFLIDLVATKAEGTAELIIFGKPLYEKAFCIKEKVEDIGMTKFGRQMTSSYGEAAGITKELCRTVKNQSEQAGRQAQLVCCPA